ncbi:MAG: hypothetical protein OXT65_05305 [Alphaproteobacteria bacterium]|nr:hypothetical protein [Alphaproteobacteria bacterium]
MKRFLPTVILAMLIFSSLSAMAQGIPVYDAAGFGQLIAQIEQMSKDYQKQLEQLDQAIQQTNALTGPRNMGALANSPLEAELRRFLPNTWQDTLRMIDTANLPNGAIGTQNLYSELYQTYQPLSGAEFITQDPESAIAKALDRKTETTYAALAASEQAYNNSAGKIKTYETLLDELNRTPDLKSSIDLQARIAAENGIALNELTRLHAIQIQQRAALDNENLMAARRASTANRFDAKETTQAFKLEEE